MIMYIFWDEGNVGYPIYSSYIAGNAIWIMYIYWREGNLRYPTYFSYIAGMWYDQLKEA